MNCPGVYTLKALDKIVYVGKSKNLKDRLLQHMFHIEYYNDWDIPSEKVKKYELLAEIKDKHIEIVPSVIFTAYNDAYCSTDSQIGRMEAYYIRKYQPYLNTQIPELFNYFKYTYNNYVDTIRKDEFYNYIVFDKSIERIEKFYDDMIFEIRKPWWLSPPKTSYTWFPDSVN